MCCEGDIQLAPAPAPELSGDAVEGWGPEEEEEEVGRYEEEEEGICLVGFAGGCPAGPRDGPCVPVGYIRGIG